MRVNMKEKEKGLLTQRRRRRIAQKRRELCRFHRLVLRCSCAFVLCPFPLGLNVGQVPRINSFPRFAHHPSFAVSLSVTPLFGHKDKYRTVHLSTWISTWVIDLDKQSHQSSNSTICGGCRLDRLVGERASCRISISEHRGPLSLFTFFPSTCHLRYVLQSWRRC